MSLSRGRRRPPDHESEGFGLLEIARAHAGEEAPSVLPPGRRDPSGFWIPSTCREPRELFTPHQRSLQEKQRSVQRTRRIASPATAPTCEPEGKTVPLPPQQSDAPPGSRAPMAARPETPPETTRPLR
jgi:hypothetical protein